MVVLKGHDCRVYFVADGFHRLLAAKELMKH
jgi:hypothetical protein